MEKSKCKTKVAALLMVLVIVFIPFGSVFAAPARGVVQTGGFGVESGPRTYNYGGTYYIQENSADHFLTGEITNYRSGFDLQLTVRNYETDRTLRRVKEHITPPSNMKSIDLLDLCNPSTKLGQNMLCSKELVAAMDLRTLPVGYYQFDFSINDTAAVSGRCIYVKVCSRSSIYFVEDTYSTLGYPHSDIMGYYAYELSKKNLSATNFVWLLYCNNPFDLNKHVPRTAAIKICRLCFLGTVSGSELFSYIQYATQNGNGSLLHKILYSDRCKSAFRSKGFMAG